MSSRPAPRYYPFLDGLRALSILAVLLFHSNSIWLEGGFLGVEVFFVISGFIITTLLRDQWLAGGGLDLRRFWLRRCRRLLPGVVTTVLATAVVVAWFYPDDWEQVREDWLAGLSFTSNWLYIISERSYFELAGRPRLFEHLWSLGVEFQYYLLWPFLCLGLFRAGKWQGALCCLGGALAAGLWMAFLYTPGDDPSRVYFGTDTRLGGLLIGSAVAFILPEPGERKRACAVDGLAWLSMAGLLWLLVNLDEAQPLLYRGGFAVVALLTSLCIFASALYPRGWVATALAWAPLRWVGVRAYNIYLWHWPVFGLSQPWVDVPLDGWALLALRLALIAVLVEVSYRWIDTPIRAGWLGKKYREWRQAGSVPHQAWTAVGLGCCGVFVVGLSSLPPFGRAATAQVVAMEQARLLGVGMEGGAAEVQPLAPLAESGGGSLADGALLEQPPAIADNTGQPSVATAPQLLCTKEEADLAPSAAPWATIIAWPEDESVALANLFALNKPAAPFLAGAMPAAGGEHWAMAGDIRSDGGVGDNSCRLPAASQQPANFQVKTRQTENGSYVFRVYPAEEGRRAVFALGDSVMLGAANVLSHSIGDIAVDAQVGRQWAAGTALLQERKRKDLLGDTVIVHLGNNGPISERQLREMLEILKDTPQVVLINLKVPRPYEAASNALLAEASSLYPNVTVVDWRGPSLMARKAFGHDGLHLTNEGARLYAQLIVQTLCKERS
jgi:peptidoglycan/LPS O-acetylase OafA/YrhL/lysophospholipase L1-like esterase